MKTSQGPTQPVCCLLLQKYFITLSTLLQIYWIGTSKDLSIPGPLHMLSTLPEMLFPSTCLILISLLQVSYPSYPLPQTSLDTPVTCFHGSPDYFEVCIIFSKYICFLVYCLSTTVKIIFISNNHVCSIHYIFLRYLIISILGDCLLLAGYLYTWMKNYH